MARTGLLLGDSPKGLMPSLEDHNLDQPAEEALKRRREKMAFRKLGIEPDKESDT